MAKTKRKLPLHYAIELLILIMGITISFMLNEWRISNNENREQRRLVQFNRIIKTGVQQQNVLMQQEAEVILDLLNEELE